jgi:diaminobutyrate acetyltransferase
MSVSVKTDSLIYRKPCMQDGAAMWRLVRDSGGLDLNSAYAYLMMADMFPDTCAVAYAGEKLAGFIMGYRKPGQQDTLFIWQIGVDSSCRGAGVGRKLLEELLERKENIAVRFVEATVGPNNAASKALFLGLAARRQAGCTIHEYYPQSLFPSGEQHEAELLFRIDLG